MVATGDVNESEDIQRKIPLSPEGDRSTDWVSQPAVHLIDRSTGCFSLQERSWTANPNILPRHGKSQRKRRERCYLKLTCRDFLHKLSNHTSGSDPPRGKVPRLPASASERPSRKAAEWFQTPQAFSLAGMIRPIPYLSGSMGAPERVESNFRRSFVGSLCNSRTYVQSGHAAHHTQRIGRLGDKSYSVNRLATSLTGFKSIPSLSSTDCIIIISSLSIPPYLIIIVPYIGMNSSTEVMKAK